MPQGSSWRTDPPVCRPGRSAQRGERGPRIASYGDEPQLLGPGQSLRDFARVTMNAIRYGIVSPKP